jgi:hypothetical protein
MMSLEPFIRVSQKNYMRLTEIKKMTGSESMDKVLDRLLDSGLGALAREGMLATSEI